MGRARRVAGVGLFALFLGGIALRPVLSNPAALAALRDGLVGWRTLVYAPLVALTLLVAALRVRSLLDDGATADGSTAQPGPVVPADDGTTPAEDGSVSADDGSTPAGDGRSRSFWDARTDTGETGEAAGPSGSREDDAGTLEPGDPGTGIGADILTGRDRVASGGKDIETGRPDARLSDHLEHLQAELADDQTVAGDLETLAELAQETEDRAVPARCPQPHCDAVWTGRTVLGIGTDQYELLDDGERVQCLHCESVVDLE